MTALNVIPPAHYVGAVESIGEVVELIGELQAKGAVYAVDDADYPDLYFARSTDPDFGSLSHLADAEALAVFAERGGDPDRPGKQDPLDCLVWRLQRPDEPGWDSPLGRGRPGWHIECTAIALNRLGQRLRRPGRWLRPDLPAPRDVRLGGAGRHRPAVRAGLRAQRDGRSRRREDVEVQGQPGAGLEAARSRRRPDGDPAGPALPALPRRLDVDRRRSWPRPSSGWPPGARPSGSTPA